MLKIGIDKKGKLPTAFMLLEPKNIQLLKEGKPIAIKLSDFLGKDIAKDYQIIVSYTPDIEFVDDCCNGQRTFDNLTRAIDASIKLPEVVRK